MRVLVTGGAGFIGKAVCAELERRECVAVVLDRPSTVTDLSDLHKATRHVDAVINLAGQLGTAETFGVETATAVVNIIGALNVADVCADRGLPMVQIGTGHKGQPNPYAITKACAEDLLIGRAEHGQEIAVVRAYHAYGPGQKAAAPHGTSPVRKIIPSFVCRALTGIPIEINGSGEQLIDLVHVDEVARVLVDAIEGPFGQVLEAGTGHALSANQTAHIVAEACGVPEAPIVHMPMRDGEPEESIVVAIDPLCEHAFPWRLDEVVEHYRALVTA